MRRLSIALVVLLSITVSEAGKNEWVEVRSKHFSVITDDGEKSGRNVLRRSEQMRRRGQLPRVGESAGDLVSLELQ